MTQSQKNYETIVKMAQNGIVTIKHIYTHFNEMDNGKRFRRHLRAKFAQHHDFNNKWQWNHMDENAKKQLMEIIDYFTQLTSPLKTPSKQQKTPSKIIVTTPSIILPSNANYDSSRKIMLK